MKDRMSRRSGTLVGNKFCGLRLLVESVLKQSKE